MNFNALLDFIFPRRETCVICGDNESKTICNACHQAIKHFQNEGRQAVRNMGSQKVIALLPYEGPVRKNIHRLKFWNRPHVARELALAFKAAQILEPMDVNVVTAVPMHRRKLIQRGYNQAELLAKEIAALQGLPYQRLIDRTRATLTQNTLGRLMRQQNVAGAFAPRFDLTGSKVLLVDDVLTTGNTVRECIKALYAANASEVTVMVVAVSRTRH